MTGRTLFKALKPILGTVTWLLARLPRGFSSFLWTLVNGMSGKMGVGFRYVVAKRLSKSCGDNVMIGPRCTILRWDQLSLGSNVTIHVGCYVDAIGGLEIGSNVSIAHGSSLLTFEHTWEAPDTPIKYNPLRYEPLRIEDDVWIGCGVRLLAGAHLKSRTVVGAGAVVPRGVYAKGVYVGIPAKLKKQI